MVTSLGLAVRLSLSLKNWSKNSAKEIPITDTRMTRFLDHPSARRRFRVLKTFSVCNVEKIYVPKIPSMKITDLGEKLWHLMFRLKSLEIRPGEKIA